jgi:hypothetical protein
MQLQRDSMGCGCCNVIRPLRQDSWMDIRLIVAIIAATASIATLAWRVYAWHRDRRPSVEVKVKNMLPTFDGPPGVGEWCFGIEATNNGPRPIRVTVAGFHLGDGRTMVLVTQPFPAALPTVIEPHDSAFTFEEVETLRANGLDVHGAITGFVDTPMGRFCSKPTELYGAEN